MSPRAGNVLEARVLGKSVRGRPITAWHLDHRPVDGRGRADGGAHRHDARQRGRDPADPALLRAARAVHGVDLWVVPVYNPDGLAARHAATRTASTSTATTPTMGRP